MKTRRTAMSGRYLMPLTGLFCLLLSLSSTSKAFEQLTPAQRLIYDTAHLANTMPGQTIRYRYEFTEGSGTELEDEVVMRVSESTEAERRDVELTFLSGERRLPMPGFTGYRGNPVIIAMLEHLAQSLGAATGGGTLYFRNRIRDALAMKNLAIESISAAHEDTEVDVKSISFSPFIKDTVLAADSPYRQAEFTIQFSDQVPAGVISIGMHAASGDRRIYRQLQLTGAP